MTVLRTPDSCFDNLPDYAFEPHYVDVPDERYGALRMHYLDEGEPDAPVILLRQRRAAGSTFTAR